MKIGARGKNMPIGSYYGEPSGIVGLRLFPNPAFDEKARKRWDSERYYRDEKYFDSKDLIKPYRVGMSCAFCHVGPNPIKPPADPRTPLGKLELECRSSVFLGRPHLQLARRAIREQLLLSTVPHGPPGITGHVARIQRQHQ